MAKISNLITVLDLRDSPWVDGPGRTVLDCAETMDPTRCRIVIGVFDGGNADSTAYEREAHKRGLTVERIHERRSLDPGVLNQIMRVARTHKADILHTHDFRSDLFGFAAARALRLPMISTVHGWIANDFRGRISTALDKIILRSADHVIAVSEQTRTQLGTWAAKQRCTVIPNALRIERYHPKRSARAFRTANGISESELIIANIGRLSPEKGQMPFLNAARDLLERHCGLRFVLFGIGPDWPKLEQFVNTHRMQERVIFAGYRSDMVEIYNELDLVVQSSVTEGMPNVVLEALLMEVPVIATDVGGTREIVKNGVTGTLIPSDDHSVLVNALEEYLSDPSTFKTKAIRGRKDIKARFDHARRLEQLGDVYDQVLNRRSRFDRCFSRG
ncbi:MAG: glycosyltransferase family 1 protein [Proteobacteria bacterium]|nr:MAG: glycosyltransferase family 1 protein [Pseudomonadota bacterium]QKK12071.1 MAG: glycosyltransferase family 4 protein [Pseudomonadota bacterium]